MKSNVIFVKFHTRLKSTDIVVVLVLVLVPYKILISRTKRIRLNRMHTACALNLIPCRSYDTSVSFSIKLAAFQAGGGAEP